MNVQMVRRHNNVGRGEPACYIELCALEPKLEADGCNLSDKVKS